MLIVVMIPEKVKAGVAKGHCQELDFQDKKNLQN